MAHVVAARTSLARHRCGGFILWRRIGKAGRFYSRGAVRVQRDRFGGLVRRRRLVTRDITGGRQTFVFVGSK